MKYVPSFLKKATRYIPFKLPILQGEGKGLWWINTEQTVNGYWIGNYEPLVQSALKELIKPGQVFWDIGAQCGFFSLIASRLVGKQGSVCSLEPVAENFHSMEKQSSLNQCQNWRKQQAALWHHDNGIEMNIRNAFTSMASELSKDEGNNNRQVPSITLEHLLDIWPRPDVIKIDIEGAESIIFKQIPDGLFNRSTKFILEIHGEEAHAVFRQFAKLCDLQWTDLNFHTISTPPIWGQCLLLPRGS